MHCAVATGFAREKIGREEQRSRRRWRGSSHACACFSTSCDKSANCCSVSKIAARRFVDFVARCNGFTNVLREKPE